MISDIVSEQTASDWASILETLPVIVDEISFSPMNKQYMVWISGEAQWPCGTIQVPGTGAVPSLAPPPDWQHRTTAGECLLRSWQAANPREPLSLKCPFADNSRVIHKDARNKKHSRTPHAFEAERAHGIPDGANDAIMKDKNKDIRSHQERRHSLHARPPYAFLMSFLLQATLGQSYSDKPSVKRPSGLTALELEVFNKARDLCHYRTDRVARNLSADWLPPDEAEWTSHSTNFLVGSFQSKR
jgi:hypothetical protein